MSKNNTHSPPVNSDEQEHLIISPYGNVSISQLGDNEYQLYADLPLDFDSDLHGSIEDWYFNLAQEILDHNDENGDITVNENGYVTLTLIEETYEVSDNMGNVLVTQSKEEVIDFFIFDCVLHPSSHPAAWCGINGTSCEHGVGNAYEIFFNDAVRALLKEYIE